LIGISGQLDLPPLRASALSGGRWSSPLMPIK
jgi:hypothetical protein